MQQWHPAYRNNIHILSERYGIDGFRELERSDEETTMRAQEFEQAVLDMRKAIGNLPDAKMGTFVFLDAARALEEDGADAIKIAEAHLAVSDSGKYASVNEEALKEITAGDQSGTSECQSV